MREYGNTEYIAHRNDAGALQTVREHALGTAALCERFASEFNCGRYGYLMGLLHDLGKYSAEFQERILHNGAKVDHSFRGAYECCMKNLTEAALCIAGHHAGLPNFGNKGDLEGSSLLARLQRNIIDPKCVPVIDEKASAKDLPPLDTPSCNPTGSLDNLAKAFRCHFLYSCLVDADFLDTEAFMKGREYEQVQADFAGLRKRLDDYVTSNYYSDNEINLQRNAILTCCRTMGQTVGRGLYTLTVPTGGGKTVSSLAFALEQACRLNQQRVIYVVPYTSIIEQNAAVFRAILGDDAVLEHHSNVYYDIENESNPDNVRKARACENWNAPVIVTTAVQFFESLYANRASKSRKVHNITNSVIVFDEAQMLPIDFLRPCVYAIAQLVTNYQATAVLCTATQPALNKLFAEYQLCPRELCPAKVYKAEVFKRVTYARKGKMTWSDLASELKGQRQALCVVNSRRNAKDLYRELCEKCPDQDSVFHLSTLMCPQHRSQKLKEIRRLLIAGETCLVVTTSLIEAGVDIDFPAVYKELAGLDSIIQAAGRCNREGYHPWQDCQVTIFESEEKSPLLFKQPIAATRSLLLQGINYDYIDSQESMHFYYSELLDLKGNNQLDRNRILELLANRCHAAIGDRFQLIENQKTVYVPYDDEGMRYVDAYKHGGHSRELLRQLSGYSVSVFPNHFKTLVEAGALQMVDMNAGTGVLDNTNLYSDNCGLSLEADAGQALFV